MLAHTMLSFLILAALPVNVFLGQTSCFTFSNSGEMHSMAYVRQHPVGLLLRREFRRCDLASGINVQRLRGGSSASSPPPEFNLYSPDAYMSPKDEGDAQADVESEEIEKESNEEDRCTTPPAVEFAPSSIAMVQEGEYGEGYSTTARSRASDEDPAQLEHWRQQTMLRRLHIIAEEWQRKAATITSATDGQRHIDQHQMDTAGTDTISAFEAVQTALQISQEADNAISNMENAVARDDIQPDTATLREVEGHLASALYRTRAVLERCVSA